MFRKDECIHYAGKQEYRRDDEYAVLFGDVLTAVSVPALVFSAAYQLMGTTLEYAFSHEKTRNMLSLQLGMYVDRFSTFLITKTVH